MNVFFKDLDNVRFQRKILRLYRKGHLWSPILKKSHTDNKDSRAELEALLIELGQSTETYPYALRNGLTVCCLYKLNSVGVFMGGFWAEDPIWLVQVSDQSDCSQHNELKEGYRHVTVTPEGHHNA